MVVPVIVVSPTIARTPVDSVTSLIAAALAMAEEPCRVVEKASSASTVPRTFTNSVAPAFWIEMSPLVSELAPTLPSAVARTWRPRSAVAAPAMLTLSVSPTFAPT